jgi:transcriptional regulator with XRE-family HTH domain
MSGKKKKTILAENVSRLRKQKGWTAEVLAEKAGIPYPTLRDIEAGISNGRANTVLNIASALGIDANQLRWDSRKGQLPNQFEHRKAFPLSDRVVYEGPTAADVAEIVKQLILVSPARRALILAVLFEEPSLLDGFPDLEPFLQAVPGVP